MKKDSIELDEMVADIFNNIFHNKKLKFNSLSIEDNIRLSYFAENIDAEVVSDSLINQTIAASYARENMEDCSLLDDILQMKTKSRSSDVRTDMLVRYCMNNMKDRKSCKKKPDINFEKIKYLEPNCTAVMASRIYLDNMHNDVIAKKTLEAKDSKDIGALLFLDYVMKKSHHNLSEMLDSADSVENGVFNVLNMLKKNFPRMNSWSRRDNNMIERSKKEKENYELIEKQKEQSKQEQKKINQEDVGQEKQEKETRECKKPQLKRQEKKIHMIIEPEYDFYKDTTRGDYENKIRDIESTLGYTCHNNAVVDKIIAKNNHSKIIRRTITLILLADLAAAGIVANHYFNIDKPANRLQAEETYQPLPPTPPQKQIHRTGNKRTRYRGTRDRETRYRETDHTRTDNTVYDNQDSHRRKGVRTQHR